MALRMFLGKPGGGKSSGALRDVVEELVYGSRIVVTNLSILPGELNAYLQEAFPGYDVDLFARLRILTEAETKRFWLYRGPSVTIPDVSKEQEKAGQFPDFGKYAGDGVLYVIDEAHVHFDARAWMDSGQSLTYYNSQHRKLNDELIFVTQFLELIDKRVRGFAQEYWYFRNNGMERIFTFFVLPAYFTVKVYQRPPTGMFDQPSEVHRYRLDLRQAKCYDTSAGVGIKGRKKPEKKQKTGLGVYWLAVPACLGLFLMYKIPDWIGQKVAGTDRGGSVISKFAEKDVGEAIGVSAEHYEKPSASEDKPVPRSRPGSRPVEPQAFVSAPVSEAYPTGYLARGTSVIVQMSDGTTRTQSDAELSEVTKNSATIGGVKYFFRAAEDRRPRAVFHRPPVSEGEVSS